MITKITLEYLEDTYAVTLYYEGVPSAYQLKVDAVNAQDDPYPWSLLNISAEDIEKGYNTLLNTNHEAVTLNTNSFEIVIEKLNIIRVKS